MSGPTVLCTKCQGSLPMEMLGTEDPAPCPACRVAIQVVVFPALATPAAAPRGDEADFRTEEEAACFYHPGKRAAVVCDHCGRFLCRLCAVVVGQRHLCPECFQVGDGSAKFTELDASRTRYDKIALWLACLPLVTPLIALYVAVRYWSRPTGLASPSRWRWPVAVVMAVCQLVCVVVLVLVLIVGI